MTNTFTKTEATAAANRILRAGYLAFVVREGSGYVVNAGNRNIRNDAMLVAYMSNVRERRAIKSQLNKADKKAGKVTKRWL